jgi:hypothetical protein
MEHYKQYDMTRNDEKYHSNKNLFTVIFRGTIIENNIFQNNNLQSSMFANYEWNPHFSSENI